MIASIISLIITLLPTILSAVGVPASIDTLIGKLGAALPGLISSLASGGGVPDAMLAILTALHGEIEALKGTLDPEKLQLADSLNDALAAALKGYGEAKITTDPSTLTPLPESL